MDHLPYPQDSPVPPVSIQYFDKFKFDGGEFTDFPARCGFDKSNFAFGDFSSIPWEEHTAFMQAWLYFGLLHECLGAPAEEFVDRDTNTITTKRLPHWGHKWRKGLPSFSRTKRMAEYERVQRALREACATLSTLDHTKPGGQKGNNLAEDVAFSMAVLGLTLDQIFTDYDLLTELGGAEEDVRQLSHAAALWPTTEFARKRLEAAGWCKSEALRLERYVRYTKRPSRVLTNVAQIKATGIYYCGSMQRIGPSVNHSKCAETGCVAENVVEETYVTAHAEDCALGRRDSGHECHHVGPIVADVAAILEADQLPVLELRREPSNPAVQLRAVPHSNSISYTALSHVWADGMGNPHANTLPQCQINRLHALLTALNGQQSHSLKSRLLGSRHKAETAYIWIDTLMIPLEKRLRKKAISRMYDIYKSAKSVLVLDRSLLDVSADRTPEELCFRLSAASWMRRAWTLQEGALANNLYVQFSEKAVSPVKLAEKAYQRVWKSAPWNVILDECGTVINYITQSGDAGGEEHLHRVLLGLGQRSTSHPEDKEICFAVMLRMDMKGVLAAEGHQRTLHIVKQMPYIPRSLLWHTQPGLEIPGYRWLPQQIIASGGGVPQLGFTLTEQGLLVETQALVFRGRTHYMHKPAQHVRDVVSGKWYVLRWEGDVATIGEKLTQSDQTWTVLAALPNRETMFKTLHAVVIRLDWALENASSAELLKHAADNPSSTGEFIGRVRLEDLEEATAARMKAKTGVKQDELREFREAVRRGESSLEGVSEAMLRLYEEEGDDSWYILDGLMESSARQWYVV